jgi:two-component system, response regulator PdtaR
MVFVLVVEDEAMVREFVGEDLREAGYQVLLASNADAAVTIMEARQDIRLVFTDVTMPGSMDGLQFAICVKSRWPQVHIVVTSGKRSPTDMPSGALFIPKPYFGRNIVETIGSFPDMLPRPATH